MEVEASFKRPILMPANVVFSYKWIENGIAFALHDKDGKVPHVVGSVVSK